MAGKGRSVRKAKSEPGIGRVFMNGRSQAVRLPLSFRIAGDKVRVRRVPEGILLEPIETDIDEIFAEIDRNRKGPFLEHGRNQPPMPADKKLFR